MGLRSNHDPSLGKNCHLVCNICHQLYYTAFFSREGYLHNQKHMPHKEKNKAKQKDNVRETQTVVAIIGSKNSLTRGKWFPLGKPSSHEIV